MKIDIKSLVIISLSIILTIFVIKSFFTTSKIEEENKILRIKNEELEIEYNEVQKERDSIHYIQSILFTKNDSILKSIKEKELKIVELDEKLYNNSLFLFKYKNELEDQQKAMFEINRKIDSLSNIPNKKEGVELLESLRKKLNK